MCGRYVTPEVAEIERLWHIGRRNYNPFDFDYRRYNTAPTTFVPIMRLAQTGALELSAARWGLIPFWWKEPKPPTHTINARAEEAATKPMWRGPLSKARCLVPAIGWYEWKEIERIDPETGEVTKAKEPHFIRLPGLRPFCFAGLLSAREDTLSCAIITQDAVGPVTEVHTRMPLVLPDEAHGDWLDPSLTDAAKALALARERAMTDFEHYLVSTRVNNARNEAPELIERLAN
jgi:putative SOS response-associated peptidase YedK